MLSYSMTTLLPRHHDTARFTRHVVVSSLASAGHTGPFGDVELLVSELVTNAMLHTSSDHVRIEAGIHDDGHVCVAVADESTLVPELRSPEAASVGGYGMSIVAALSASWGVLPLEDAKLVWAELPA